jgi:hypothetical protein
VSEARQAGQQRPPTPSTPARAPSPPPGPQQSSPGTFIEARDARQTREQLNNVLEQHPPSLREVLRIDPTLLYNDNYLATYPALAGFLQQHPEVAHNPSFFIGERRFDERNDSPQMEAARALRNMTEMIGIILVVMTITAGVIFLVRTVVEHRRWQRAMRAQTELNTKLIDRFASSDELLAYLQSPQGKTLTEAPALPQPAARAMDAPLGRIFWSLQAGAVIAFGGAGILFAASRMRDELAVVAPTLLAFGTVVLTVGVGFLVSSAISYLLSQRLGLVRPMAARMSGEAPGS